MNSAALLGILLLAAIILAVLYYFGKFVWAAVRFQRKHGAASESAAARIREFAATSSAERESERVGGNEQPPSTKDGPPSG